MWFDESPCLGPFNDFPFLCHSFQDENDLKKKISLKKYPQWMRCKSLLYRSELKKKSPKSNWSGRMDAVHTLLKIRCSQISTLSSRFSVWIAWVYFSIVVWLVPCLHFSLVKEFEVNWLLFSNFGAFFFQFLSRSVCKMNINCWCCLLQLGLSRCQLFKAQDSVNGVAD